MSRASLARSFLLFGLSREACDLYYDALQGSPDSQALLVGLARAEAASGHWRQALAAFRRVRRLNPRNCDALAGMGELFKSRGRLKAAKSCFRVVAELAPGRQDGWVGLALLLWREGNPDKAGDLLSAAVARRLVASVHESQVSRRCEALALLACIRRGQGRVDDALAAVMRMTLREVRETHLGNPLWDFLRAIDHPEGPRVLEMASAHAQKLEERSARRWAPSRESFVPVERKIPEDRGCGKCGGKASFLTATGGGAGMVYLIFKCKGCGGCFSVK